MQVMRVKGSSKFALYTELTMQFHAHAHAHAHAHTLHTQIADVRYVQDFLDHFLNMPAKKSSKKRLRDLHEQLETLTEQNGKKVCPLPDYKLSCICTRTRTGRSAHFHRHFAACGCLCHTLCAI